MRIYFSGIGGVGIGPLAEIAHDAGYDVIGSDAAEGLMTEELRRGNIEVFIGQDGSQIASAHADAPIDWFCYSSALPDGHPELIFAREHSIKTSKRDELLAHILREKQLKLIAVAGTHGKTTTTGLAVWTLKQLGIPVSYSVGTTLSFGPSGAFNPASEYFIYECDEYDRNFLHFEPYISIIPSIDHDHFDIYPTAREYMDAFIEFMEQSGQSFLWGKDLRALDSPDIAASYEAYDELMDLSSIHLAGDHVRHNAYLVEQAVQHILPDASLDAIRQAINTFPGTARRFEKLADNLYSDYGHHPAEIAATLQMARELSDHVILIYQPHQNSRQHEIRDDYRNSMHLAEVIYWLPTYLSREDPNLEILSPKQLIAGLANNENAQPAEMDEELWQSITTHREQNHLVICMGAGTIDGWVRDQLALMRLTD